MAVNFLDPKTLKVSNGQQRASSSASSKVSKTLESIITTSADVSGIELRLVPPLIKDNHTPKVWPFPGYAKLYCLTIVVSDVQNQLVGAIDLKGFPRIGDNEHLPINKTLFYWQAETKQDTSPNQIHVMCSIVKSKEALRNTATILSNIKADKEYKSLIGNLGKVAKGAAQFNAVTDLIVDIAGIVGRYLGKVEDKPLATVINSYTTVNGDFDKIGINPYPYVTRNVVFTFHLTVRNQIKEKQQSTENDFESVESSRELIIQKSMEVFAEEEVEVEMMPL